MGDMTPLLVAKSDQINAEDLVGRTLTVTIDRVTIRGGDEQPISISLRGHDKVYRPCKSMCRVMSKAWGNESKNYVGKSMTLYNDPNVKFGSLKTGGIRISHMSDIEDDMLIALQAKKGVIKGHQVKPLAIEKPTAAANPDPAATWASGFIAKVKICGDLESLGALERERAAKLSELQEKRPELHASVVAAVSSARDALGSSVGPADTGESQTTKDALAQALKHLRAKVTQEDVLSLREVHTGGLDPSDQDAWLEECQAKIDAIKRGEVA